TGPRGVAAVISLATLVFGATGVFVQLKAALNKVWAVQIKPEQPRSTLLRLVWDRGVSFAMMLVIAFLLLASLAVSAALAALARWSSQLVPGWEMPIQLINAGVSFGVITFLFCGAVTALLFTIGKELIGMYLGRGSIASIYGAAGSMIVILLWVYYSSIIFHLLVRRRGNTALGQGPRVAARAHLGRGAACPG